MKSALKRVFRNFLENSTLHGFKYLRSPFFCDRIGWVLFCIVSLCCGSALCIALWDRYLATPALLTLSIDADDRTPPIPMICVCPTPQTVAEMFAKNLNISTTVTSWLAGVLHRIFRRQVTGRQTLLQLDHLLTSNNLTLVDALTKFTPPCDSLFKKCIWQHKYLPCKEVIQKDMTPWGLCCSMTADTIPQEYLNQTLRYKEFVSLNNVVMLALNCVGEGDSKTAPFEFITKYSGEEWSPPIQLSKGSQNRATLVLSTISSSDEQQLKDNVCDPSEHYSKRRCLLQCKEKICGCSDPLRPLRNLDDEGRQTCSVSEYNCLVENYDKSCPCVPPCSTIKSSLTFIGRQMDAIQHTFDPFYQDLNRSDVILEVIVKTQSTKSFRSRPTETWLTLMSSLGGVFNMFLGVGLLSALEVIFLIFIQVPIALSKSDETDLVKTTPKLVQPKKKF